MTTSIQVPFWLFGILLIVTIWALFSRALFPGVRWVFRRRIYKVIDEIADHLDIEIRPFQLTKRQVLIDRLTFDPKIMEAVQDASETNQKPLEAVQREAERYAKEIIPSFNAYLYFRIGYWLAKKIARWLYKVRVGRIDQDLSNIDSNSTVVFVMNHRSNMDYILVAFLAMERTTISYAVGEWARIWPLNTLIRAMGAYFVRRNSRNPLYRQVLERYIHMATKEGVCQAIFIEGGLSKDGKIRKPKLGLIDYMMRSFDPEKDRNIVFIPVGINYDRTIEDRSLLRRLEPDVQKRGRWFIFKTTAGFIARNLTQMALRKWQRFGYACVNFGEPISIDQYCRDHGFVFKDLDRQTRFDKVEILCEDLTAAIKKVIPVLPVALVATAILQKKDVSHSPHDLRNNINDLIEDLRRKGASIYHPKQNFEQYIELALEMLITRHMILLENDRLKANPEMIDILLYYANSISHWLEEA